MDILFKGTLECLNFNDVSASDEIANCTLHIINRYRMSKWSLGGSNSNTMQLQFYSINLNPIFFNLDGLYPVLEENLEAFQELAK